MNEMLKTIEPKSDQLNADDLLGDRTITIKITDVAILARDQPVALQYEGDNGKPYKPCKSMRRVLVTVWGSDAKLYTGRCMTLYRDDKVTYGSIAVGGIRISHMSGIDKEVTMALTATRASRKPYTVKPLAEAVEVLDEQPDFDLIEAGNDAAKSGMLALESFWKGISGKDRQKLGMAQLETWKGAATNAAKAGA